MSQDILLQAQTSVVTQEAKERAVQKDIEYSVKIGKQVLLKQLKERKEALYKDYQIGTENKQKFFKSENEKITKIIEKEFWLNIKNCSKLNTLRLAINAFLPKEEKFRANKNMIIVEDCYNATSKKPTKNGYLEVCYYLNIAVNNKENRSDQYDHEWENRFSSEIEIPDVLKGYWREAERLDKICVDLNMQINEIDTKIKNIDSVMEEMEANLLIKEMERSNRGLEVLKMTNSILSDVLDDTSLKLESK